MAFLRSPEVDAALSQASEECGLPDYYADNARRLLGEPMRRWPRCCAGNCEPCAVVLVKVAIGFSIIGELKSITGGDIGLQGIPRLSLFGWQLTSDQAYARLAGVALLGVVVVTRNLIA